VYARTSTGPSSRVCLLGNNCTNTLLVFVSVVSHSRSLSLNAPLVSSVKFHIIAERLSSSTQSSITHRKSKEYQSTAIMAGKEATVYILDLGASMDRKRHGRDHTDLEWALDYVWDKITTTVC
jgi:hypothetical protein